MRAFLNGRMDLSQAEAVRDIIDATTLYQAQVAARQRAGSLARQIRPIKEQLIGIIVNLESAVEFVEHDLPVASRASIAGKLRSLQAQLLDGIDSFRRGRIVRDGFSMAIVGRPNVGKSSLFNALLVQSRSIVTEMPGTTRDLISEFTSIGGIPVRLQDTAGIHDSGSLVEKLGIDRSLQAIADADAVVLVVDTSCPLGPQDLMIKEQLRNLECFVAMNKSDLVPRWLPLQKQEFAGEWPFIEVSAKTGAGIEELRGRILGKILGPAGTHLDGMLVTNLRHYRNLEAAGKAMARASAALREGLSEEFALIDLREGLRKLDEITGETGVENILTEIFSHFCIGK
jgi:tRNA modification GTPase